jgi:hypothetical protein
MADRPRWLRISLVALDFTVPLALFYGLRALGVSAYLSLLAGALASLVSAGVTLLRDRRMNGVAAYMTTMLVLSTLVTLVAGSPRFLLARDAFVTGATGLWFIASCWSQRPLAYHFARAVGEGRFGWPPDWEDRWERAPRFRRMWRVSSLLWGIGALLDATLRWVMAYSLPIDVVPLLNQVLYIGTTAVLFVVTNAYYVLSGAMRGDSPLYDPPGSLRRQRVSAAWRSPSRPRADSRSASS